MPNPAQQKWFTQNDRRTSIADILTDGKGNPLDLSNSTVAFRMVKKSDSTVKVNNAAATIDSTTKGEVSYAWGASDLDTAGSFWAWWILTSGGKTEHFPGDGKKLTVIVEPAL